ncbi:MAG: LamG-like jellyroll fold domain-containing protein [Candidatus Paceibacterota bacterium]|jgi:prepilin-type N-terminal cleavage/methylation domain-containing protein
MNSSKSHKGFTLIELLIVIGILAVLATVVLTVLNPVEFFKKSRDVRRMTDLKSLNSGLELAEFESLAMGTANVVYVSIPDDSGGATTTCNLGLPALPGGWTYQCSNTDNYRKADGTGWIPVNFSNISAGSPFPSLPIDPTNATSSGQYYTYVTGGSWELNAILESNEYRNNTSIVKQKLPGVFAIGSNLSLSPITNTSGLVGYWKLDEGTGTVASDSSGNNNACTLTSGPTWITGKVGNSLNFNGSSNYVNCENGASLNIIGNTISLSAWIKPNDFVASYKSIIGKRNGGEAYTLETYTNGNVRFGTYGTSNAELLTTTNPLSIGGWYQVVGVYNGTNKYIYVNGILVKSVAATGNILTSGSKVGIGSLNGNGAIGPFNGVIDDVRIYNRALSAAEVQALYNATK